MGFDIDVNIFYGYKIPLSWCFEKGIVNPQIIEGDDWQFINMSEDLETLIDKHVLSDTLKKFMSSGQWKLYFVCPTQSDTDPEKSWMIIYCGRQTLASGTPEDYVIGHVNSSPLWNTNEMTDEMCKLFDADIRYGPSYTVECSW